MQDFDLIVIGSGPGGYRAAVLATLRGMKVAVVERSEWGGCCLNRGCVPKRDWHHSAQLIAASRDFAGRGIRGKLAGDLAAAWRHQKAVVETVRTSYRDYMQRLGIAAFQGTGSFVDATTIAVDGDPAMRGKHIIIATGSSPFVPDGFALSPGKILTSDDLFDAPPPPGMRVGLVGSGAIGTEFAFILAMFGLDVVWLAQTQPLSGAGFSQPALKLLDAALARCGIGIRADSRAAGATAEAGGVRLALYGGGEETVDWVLLGTGRRPHFEALNLAAAGVEITEKGFVQVNAHLQTNLPHIYAIGDVANRYMTANHALADAAVAVANICAPGSRRQRNDAVPLLVYSALELARIGLSEEQAEHEGREPALGFASFGANPRALGQDDSEGFVRIIADMDSGELLGAEIAGSEAGELIHGFAQAYGSENALATLAAAFYNHPARAEELLNATETLAAQWGLGAHVFGTG